MTLRPHHPSDAAEIHRFVEDELALGLVGNWIARKSPQHPLTWKIVPRETPPGGAADQDYELWVAGDLTWWAFLWGNSDDTGSPVERFLLNARVVKPPPVRSHNLAGAARTIAQEAPPNRWPTRTTARYLASSRPPFADATEAAAYVEREVAEGLTEMCMLKICQGCGLHWLIEPPLDPKQPPPDYDAHTALVAYYLSLTKDLSLFVLHHGGAKSESRPGAGCLVLECTALERCSLRQAVAHGLKTYWPGCSEFPTRCTACGGVFGPQGTGLSLPGGRA